MYSKVNDDLFKPKNIAFKLNFCLKNVMIRSGENET